MDVRSSVACIERRLRKFIGIWQDADLYEQMKVMGPEANADCISVLWR